MKTAGGLFVTGTDTGVGKTLFVSIFGAILRAEGVDFGLCKPVQTGAAAGGSPDLEVYKRFFALPDPEEMVVPLRLRAPQAPSIAAALQGKTIRVEKLERSLYILKKKHGNLLAEGAGGLMVPISGNYLMRDLIKASGLAALVVARPGLGTINHTSLTFSELSHRGIASAGFVVSRVADSGDRLFLKVVGQIEKIIRRPYLGCLGAFRKVSASEIPAMVHSARRTLRLKSLFGFFK